ncbi:MAG TPA: glycosyltransferase family 87 protein [Vicinamibacterales bacterium]|nr:glycosyltransferase family 87 protein [Vicinamibacterales bacterium]
MAFVASRTRTRLLLGLLAAVSLAALFTTRVARKMPDFEVYWTAGARARVAAPLYRAEDGHFQFKYLPAFAIAAIPLSRMPQPVAKAVWFAVSAVLIMVLLGLSVRALPDLRRPPPLLVVLTFAAMAKFYAHELVLGQVNLLFAVIVTAAVVCLLERRRITGGLLFAAAVIVKPYGLLFAPWLLSRRDRLPFLATALGLAIVLILPAALYGWRGNIDLHRDWWQTVTASTPPNLLNQDNISLAALFAKWFGSAGQTRLLAAGASLTLLGLVAVVVAGRGTLLRTDALETALLLLLIPLLSPQGWDYVLLISTPAVMLLLNDLSRVPGALRTAAVIAVAVAALSIYDLLGRAVYAEFMALSLITVCVLVEFAALVSLRFARAA